IVVAEDRLQLLRLIPGVPWQREISHDLFLSSKEKGLRDRLAQPSFVGASGNPQNIRPSLTRTQRPFLTCCTCVMVVARWLVFENIVGGELKISWNLSPDSSASSIFWPEKSLPALLA